MNAIAGALDAPVWRNTSFEEVFALSPRPLQKAVADCLAHVHEPSSCSSAPWAREDRAASTLIWSCKAFCDIEPCTSSATRARAAPVQADSRFLPLAGTPQARQQLVQAAHRGRDFPAMEDRRHQR